MLKWRLRWFGRKYTAAAATALVAAVALGVCAPPVGAQTGTVRGVVVATPGGSVLPYSDVTVLPDGAKRFTSDSGTFTLTDLPAGSVKIRVRHLGFEPRDLTIEVAADATTPVRVELKQLAITLSAVRVAERFSCTAPGAPQPSADTVLAAVFDQLSQNADRYDLLMREYPFVSNYEITTATVIGDSSTMNYTDNMARVDSKSRWSYVPGQVVRSRNFGGALVNVPTLDVFANPRFVNAHCFRYGGLELVDGDTLLRVDFRVSDRVHDPDFDGSIYLDPHGYLIRRSVLRLTNADEVLVHADSSKIVTRFDELLPGVPFVADIISTVYIKPAERGKYTGVPSLTGEERRRIAVQFTDKRPADAHVAEVEPIVAPYRIRAPDVPRILGVFDSDTGDPIPYVAVTDSVTHRSEETSATGTLRLDFITQAGGVLTFEKKGYATTSLRVSAAKGDTLPVTVVMSKKPTR